MSFSTGAIAEAENRPNTLTCRPISSLHQWFWRPWDPSATTNSLSSISRIVVILLFPVTVLSIKLATYLHSALAVNVFQVGSSQRLVLSLLWTRAMHGPSRILDSLTAQALRRGIIGCFPRLRLRNREKTFQLSRANMWHLCWRKQQSEI